MVSGGGGAGLADRHHRAGLWRDRGRGPRPGGHCRSWSGRRSDPQYPQLDESAGRPKRPRNNSYLKTPMPPGFDPLLDVIANIRSPG